MNHEPQPNTSRDYDRKHHDGHKGHEGHASKNPKAAKGEFTREELKSYPKEDKRELAREEHTNHFTNRASSKP